MDTFTANVMVPGFFALCALATFAIGGWIFAQQGHKPRYFGLGMLSNAVGFSFWAYAAAAHPTNLRFIVGCGVIPLLIGHYFFLQVHTPNYKAKYRVLLNVAFLALAIFTFIFRSYIRPSDPYFSAKGLLYFNLDPVTSWLYIAIFSLTRLPAIHNFCTKIKQSTVRTVLSINCYTLFVCSIILVSSNNDELLLINGSIMGLSLLMTVLTIPHYPKFKAA